ncbi:hypothetical protein AK812_SmicGene8762 [Symbiodinium microadriaticum]|uniref:Uncharacterized protein n=1 Tax=Symbiodinium microadriaticum TaxID=2951 RepID=A0A1Q9EK54_SYMMI|nr:hypothetical protein AK812_SmicGene8762 [Symbiodinium microadriaticum]
MASWGDSPEAAPRVNGSSPLTAKSPSHLDNHSLLQNADTISQAKSELQQTLKQQRTEAFVHAVPSPLKRNGREDLAKS